MVSDCLIKQQVVIASLSLVLLLGYSKVTYAACYEYEFNYSPAQECSIFYSSVTISTCSGSLIDITYADPGSLGKIYYWSKYLRNPDGTRTLISPATGYCLKSKEDEIFVNGIGCCPEPEPEKGFGPPTC